MSYFRWPKWLCRVALFCKSLTASGDPVGGSACAARMTLGIAEKWVLQRRAIAVLCQKTGEKTIPGVNSFLSELFVTNGWLKRPKNC